MCPDLKDGQMKRNTTKNKSMRHKQDAKQNLFNNWRSRSHEDQNLAKKDL